MSDHGNEMLQSLSHIVGCHISQWAVLTRPRDKDKDAAMDAQTDNQMNRQDYRFSRVHGSLLAGKNKQSLWK